MLTEDGRESIWKSNSTRNFKCGKCGSLGTDIVDGGKIGGLPGIQYRYCPGCGWSNAIRPRGTRSRLPAVAPAKKGNYIHGYI
jgi:hypothetical protein